jgi:hypothetical protein
MLYKMLMETEDNGMKTFFLFPQKKMKTLFLTLDKVAKERFQFGDFFAKRAASLIPARSILSNSCQTDGVQVK